MQIEKTVFISYRRTNTFMALAVYQYLTAQEYDCFLDYKSIEAGSFERIILNQVAARAHFIVILTPSALERCAEPGDWLRREIEYALEQKRNIIPLMFEGFRFSDVQKYLTGKLEVLQRYNALEIPSAYFEEAMNRLQIRFLSKPLDVVLHPTPKADRQVVADTKAKAQQQSSVTEQLLSAEEWFERGLKRAKTDYDGKIADYSEAIRHNPQNAKAYNNRGLARYLKGDLDGSIADYNRSIELKNSELHFPYYNRGLARHDKGDLEGALADYSEAIRLNPQYAKAYYNQGLAHYTKGDLDGALADYSEAIRLNPQYAKAYNSRGDLFYQKADYERAIPDFEAVVQIDPNNTNAKSSLELARQQKARSDNGKG